MTELIIFLFTNEGDKEGKEDNIGNKKKKRHNMQYWYKLQPLWNVIKFSLKTLKNKNKLLVLWAILIGPFSWNMGRFCCIRPRSELLVANDHNPVYLLLFWHRNKNINGGFNPVYLLLFWHNDNLYYVYYTFNLYPKTYTINIEWK